MSLPWNEKVVSFQVHPDGATRLDIVRMAEELVSLWRGEYICQKCGLRKDGEDEDHDF